MSATEPRTPHGHDDDVISECRRDSDLRGRLSSITCFGLDVTRPINPIVPRGGSTIWGG